MGTDARKDLLSTYGIYLKSIPFQPFPDLKDLPKRDWADQQGDDEFIPANPVFKAYETTVDFVYVGGRGSARDAIYAFIQYIQGGEFSLWDEWKEKGIRCRYVGYVDNAFYSREGDIITFSVKLKVNNPLCYGRKLIGGDDFISTADCNLVIYWGDGTVDSYIKNESITKTFQHNPDFAIIVPAKLSSIQTA